MLVLGYHAFVRWPQVVPYGDSYAGFPLFYFGWLGVRLFFLVSGFVILMTLERSQSWSDFLSRRWLRLFPAMLVCSFLLYVTARWLPDRPEGSPSLDSVLPGLTFIEPAWWHKALGIAGKPLEGAFWSLFVEFKFYVFAALTYFWVGRTGMIRLLALVYFAAVTVRLGAVLTANPALQAMDALFFQLSFPHFGWFAAGSAFYVYWATRGQTWFFIGLALALVSAFGSSAQYGGSRLGAGLGGVLITLLFAYSLRSAWLQRILTSRMLLFLGFVSYPLYLLHENAMVAMTAMLGRAYPAMPKLSMPLAPIILLCIVSFLIARFEPQLRDLLRSVSALIVGPRSRPIKP